MTATYHGGAVAAGHRATAEAAAEILQDGGTAFDAAIAALAAACEHGGPSLVDIICQPLHEARAPVSEWVA